MGGVLVEGRGGKIFNECIPILRECCTYAGQSMEVLAKFVVVPRPCGVMPACGWAFTNTVTSLDFCDFPHGRVGGEDVDIPNSSTYVPTGLHAYMRNIRHMYSCTYIHAYILA